MNHILIDRPPQQRRPDQTHQGAEYHQNADNKQSRMIGLEIIRQPPQSTAPVFGFLAGGSPAAMTADVARTRCRAAAISHRSRSMPGRLQKF